MMDAHVEIMKLAIGYTCVGIFIATAVAAILDLFNFIKIDPNIKKKLQTTLIIEVVLISVAVFSGLLKVNPKPVIENVQATQVQLKASKQLLTPRVFIHIGNESQRPVMTKLQQSIKELGFDAPGIENVSGKGDLPKNPNVRYFNDEDEQNAGVVAEILKSLGFPTAYPYRVQGMSARIGTLEVWLVAK